MFKEESDHDRKEVRCNRCRERGLYWREVRNAYRRVRWILVDEDGNPHNCPKRNTASIDEFEPQS